MNRLKSFYGMRSRQCSVDSVAHFPKYLFHNCSLIICRDYN